MPELIETDLHAAAVLAETLGRHAAALHVVFMRGFVDVLFKKERSLRDVSRALKAQNQSRTALRLVLKLRAVIESEKNREIERTDYWERKFPITTKPLEKPLRKPACGRAKRRRKGLSLSRRALPSGIQKSGVFAVGMCWSDPPPKCGFSAQTTSGHSAGHGLITGRYVTRADHGVVKTPSSSTVNST